MNKTLPTLSKAQREAWARILRTRHADGHFNQALASNRTLKALVNKGMLIAEVNSIGWTEYTIAPDYLPAPAPAPAPAPEADASDQDAAPVGETPRFKVGDVVTPITGMWEGATCKVVKVWVDMFNIDRYMIEDTMGRDGIVSYKDHELAPATSSEPGEPEAADDDEKWYEAFAYGYACGQQYPEVTLDAERAEVLDAMMASYERRIAELEAENETLRGKIHQFEQARDFWRTKHERTVEENQRLRVFLAAIEDEATTDLGEWLGVAFDQVFPSKQAMKAIYEGARDALNPPEWES